MWIRIPNTALPKTLGAGTRYREITDMGYQYSRVSTFLCCFPHTESKKTSMNAIYEHDFVGYIR